MHYQTTGIDEYFFIVAAGLSINRVRPSLMPGWRWDSQHTFPANDAAGGYESPCQFIAKKVVSMTFWPYVPFMAPKSCDIVNQSRLCLASMTLHCMQSIFSMRMIWIYLRIIWKLTSWWVWQPQGSLFMVRSPFQDSDLISAGLAAY